MLDSAHIILQATTAYQVTVNDEVVGSLWWDGCQWIVLSGNGLAVSSKTEGAIALLQWWHRAKVEEVGNE